MIHRTSTDNVENYCDTKKEATYNYNTNAYISGEKHYFEDWNKKTRMAHKYKDGIIRNRFNW